MNKNIIAILFIVWLTGCASLPSNTSYGDQNSTQERVQKLLQSKSDVSLVLTVPSSVQYLANAMQLAAIQSGSDTNAVIALVTALKQNNGKSLTVVGDNDSITAATIISAINKLNGTKSTSKIYFAGEQKYSDKIKATADKAGIQFESVIYP